jgi:hypothetical protein
VSERAALDARVLSWIAVGVAGAPDDARFEALALDLFRYQHAHNAAYRRICAAFEVDPARVRRWQDIPAVPTGAFKEARLACFPPERTVREFRSSGTTTSRPGVLGLDTLALYEASLLATFRAWICPDVARIRFLVLAPPAREAPHSSLSYMFDHAVAKLGTKESAFYVGTQSFDRERACADLAGARERVAVVGTAFAFVHLLDALAATGRRVALPAGSRAMETGGFKGRSRSLSRAELHGAIAEGLGLPPARIVNQYGMCELASQFYEASLVSGEPSTVKRVPPWVRTRVVDPETLADAPFGARGMLLHYDLANTGSVLAVQTSDEGRLAAGGFEVFGRLAGAEARGCSIAADALLERA